MEIKVFDTNIFYEKVGGGKKCVVFLCGWGYGSEIIKPLSKNLEGYTKIFIDFPGFGKSGQIKQDLNLESYGLIVKAVLDAEKIEKAAILGHSFGGKVAIFCAVRYNICEKLVLVASAGIKPKKSLKKTFQVLRYKRAKKRGRDVSRFGSSDYLALPKSARKTFVNIVNTHIDLFLQNVTCKTLILAGKQDKDTPLYMQKKLHKHIKGSILKVYNTGHYVWVGAFKQVTAEIKEFLGN